MALFEIVRFVLPLCQKSDFAKLREYLSFHGGIRDQYFGDMIAPSNAALPIKTNEVCWAIRTFSALLYLFLANATIQSGRMALRCEQTQNLDLN